MGDDDWVVGSIREGTCVVVTDGSYMEVLYPEISSAAVVLEYCHGRGRICCSFAKASRGACSYRWELCGLLAIHLILLVVNETDPGLRGSVHIYSDCLLALNKINSLPSSRIPTSWAHSNILKTIMLNCEKLSFNVHYSHVKAHQDDSAKFAELSRPSQLNCMMDYQAKESSVGPTANGVAKALTAALRGGKRIHWRGKDHHRWNERATLSGAQMPC
jgi:hypothetical protein